MTEKNWNGNYDAEFSELLGRTITKIEGGVGDVELTFICDDGTKYRMFHDQDCCESVDIEDIAGDLNDLIGSPITLVDESTNSEENPSDTKKDTSYQESFTWTFYRLETIKGSVTLRWYGHSNGYYSEAVDFERLAL